MSPPNTSASFRVLMNMPSIGRLPNDEANLIALSTEPSLAVAQGYSANGALQPRHDTLTMMMSMSAPPALHLSSNHFASGTLQPYYDPLITPMPMSDFEGANMPIADQWQGIYPAGVDYGFPYRQEPQILEANVALENSVMPTHNPHQTHRVFGSEARDRDHARRRKGPAGTDFICALCNKSLARKYNLKEHMKRHNNLRLLPCRIPDCSAYFRTQSDRRSHFKKSHKGEVRKDDGAWLLDGQRVNMNG